MMMVAVVEGGSQRWWIGALELLGDG